VELPEVETIVRTLAPRAVGRRIESVSVFRRDLLKLATPEAVRKAFAGSCIAGIRRRAKFILIDADGGFTLIVHLAMGGKLLSVPTGAPREEHTHLTLRLDGGCDVRMVDVRHFGKASLARTDEALTHPFFARIGVEYDDAEFTPDALHMLLAGHPKLAVKQFLLDQAGISGIGNIYASEVLYRAGISPAKPCASLTRPWAALLHGVIREVLSEAICNRGTSIRDYVDATGRGGGHQSALKVYGREGEPCPACGRPIVRIVQGQRSTFFCPRCQR